MIERERRCPSTDVEAFSLFQNCMEQSVNKENGHSFRPQEPFNCSELSPSCPAQSRGNDSDNASITTFSDMLDLPESRFSWQLAQSAARTRTGSAQDTSPQPCGKDSSKLTKEGYNFASSNIELPNQFCKPEDRPDARDCTDGVAHVEEDVHYGGRHAQGASPDTCFPKNDQGNKPGNDRGVGTHPLYDPFSEQPLDFRFWFAPENGCREQSRHSKFAPGQRIVIRDVANELWEEECRGRCDFVFVRPQPTGYSSLPEEIHVLVYLVSCRFACLIASIRQDSFGEIFSFNACAYNSRFSRHRRARHDETEHGGFIVEITRISDAISFMQDFEPVPGIELVGQHQISDEVPSRYGSVHYGLVGAQENDLLRAYLKARLMISTSNPTVRVEAWVLPAGKTSQYRHNP